MKKLIVTVLALAVPLALAAVGARRGLANPPAPGPKISPTVTAAPGIGPSVTPKTCGDHTACDCDGDGHRSYACGGDDCDDFDNDRYPRGGAEMCFDPRHPPDHDEDCNPCTVAAIGEFVLTDGDRDKDGFVSAECSNLWGPWDGVGVPAPSTAPPKCGIHVVLLKPENGMPGRVVGTDCDDGNYSVGPGAQVCTPDRTGVKNCGGSATAPPNAGGGNGATWRAQPCPPGPSGRPGRCVVQPNGTGVCVN